MDITFLINQCLKLDYSKKAIIETKIDNLQKVNNILSLNGCKLIKTKNEKFILIKTPKPLAIFNPDVEIKDIIKSKEDIPKKLKKIEKIIKTYAINEDTKEELMKFLNKLEGIVNEKLKKEIENIKKNIRVKSTAFA
ncbi:hypothetical protein [Caminibacter pacificus]|uniref:Uncharacterized protein n=1 Tax=Caminibacter pacificus TaxID=1424653 RepID=A0AAJ4REN4_9BACT|nr:hypothetical protein [Caminibacter pacificus]QCI28092.1 hypothetical protein C6V80_03715 [Caminibacter pacificus]ROR41199.1 hypothetical protein EDC58_0684 [Caminibacter pacificus]